MCHLLTANRSRSAADWTLSRLMVRGADFCAGIEDESRPVGAEVYGETCVPCGVYPLGLRQSPRFSASFYTKDGVNLIERDAWLKLRSVEKLLYKPHELIWMRGALEKRLILLHWGNTDDDTLGCYIVGEKHGVIGLQAAVLNSRRTYVKLYAAVVQQVRAGNQFIEYRNV